MRGGVESGELKRTLTPKLNSEFKLSVNLEANRIEFKKLSSYSNRPVRSTSPLRNVWNRGK